MTENKRFTLSKDKYDETIFNNGTAMGIIDVVEKLNELHEENKVLKVTTGEMEDYLARMEEENKELKDKSYFKKEIERLRLQNKDLLKSNAKLREENKELKSLCKVLIKQIDEKSIAFVIDEEVRRLLE